MESWAGTLSTERPEHLEGVDASWGPVALAVQQHAFPRPAAPGPCSSARNARLAVKGGNRMIQLVSENKTYVSSLHDRRTVRGPECDSSKAGGLVVQRACLRAVHPSRGDGPFSSLPHPPGRRPGPSGGSEFPVADLYAKASRPERGFVNSRTHSSPFSVAHGCQEAVPSGQHGRYARGQCAAGGRREAPRVPAAGGRQRPRCDHG